MNRKDFIAKIADKANLTQKEAAAFLNAFTETVEETIASGDQINLTGFGTFETTVRKPRNGVNPRTKEQMHVPEQVVPKFKPSRLLKNAVSNQ